MIHTFKYCVEKNKEIGTVDQIKGPLVFVKGLEGSKIGEGISFDSGDHGLVMAIKNEFTEVLVFSRNSLKAGSFVGRTGKQLSISAGEGLLGHIVNALGYTLDDRREDSIVSKSISVEKKPVGISERKSVTRFLETGVSVVDTLVPLGLGQRELVIGDRKSGKTSFLLQTLLSQAKHERVCIYTLIGKRKSEVKEIYSFLKENEALKNSIMVVASAEDSPGENFLAPYTAMSLAEYFKDQGVDTLVILDDLTAHAKYFREISLVGGRFPGRESYPGDIFYIHSKLLERAGNFKEASITCIPVAEAPSGDITGYIQTNLMSMTDGHIYFDSDMFYKGLRPAINVFLSVTRVGKQTQDPELREIAGKALALLKQSEEMSRFLRFGSEVSPSILVLLQKAERITEFFNQLPNESRTIKETKEKLKEILG
jgi:F-type H+-transporting ATPase subunit alpha